MTIAARRTRRGLSKQRRGSFDALEYFRQLGTAVDAKWRAKDYDERVFPQLAHEALSKRPAYREVNVVDILDLAIDACEITPQFSEGNDFGQPPVTVFRASEFFIDVLFWQDATTAIHNHAFGGAFQVLAGSSVHGKWLYRLKERVNLQFLVGDLELSRMNLLMPGDGAAIIPGGGLIHSLFHLDSPSVTVVIRTPKQPDALPQYRYLRPHFAVATSNDNSRGRLRVEALGALESLDPRRFLQRLTDVACRLDFPTAFQVVATHVQGRSAAELDAVVRALFRHHGPKARLIPTVMKEVQRQSHIVNKRRSIRSNDHRFFLAVLLNAPSREVALRLVRERYPSANPVQTVFRWLCELSHRSNNHGESVETLGIELAENERVILRHILSDLDDDELIRRLRKHFTEEDLNENDTELRRLHRLWREHPMLSPLFRG